MCNWRSENKIVTPRTLPFHWWVLFHSMCIAQLKMIPFRIWEVDWSLKCFFFINWLSKFVECSACSIMNICYMVSSYEYNYANVLFIFTPYYTENIQKFGQVWCSNIKSEGSTKRSNLLANLWFHWIEMYPMGFLIFITLKTRKNAISDW